MQGKRKDRINAWQGTHVRWDCYFGDQGAMRKQVEYSGG